MSVFIDRHKKQLASGTYVLLGHSACTKAPVWKPPPNQGTTSVILRPSKFGLSVRLEYIVFAGLHYYTPLVTRT